jgi:hypothetical protein
VDITNFLRSLSFGGLLGGGLAYLLFLSHPQLFAERATLEAVVIFGSVLGAALHRVIDACLIKTFLLPFGRFINHYGTLVHLTIRKRAGLMEDDEYRHIMTDLDRKYFLGQDEPARIQQPMLPPKD